MPRPLPPLVRSLARGGLDLIFPRCCVHCQRPADAGAFAFFCRACARALHIVQPPACQTCGHPFFGRLDGARSCPHCEALAPVFSRGKTLFLARGPGLALLHELKYRAGFYVLGDIDRMIAETPHYRSFLAGATLVPVPLHPTRLRERGFNQSERIARQLARSGDAEGVRPLLRRRMHTASQTRLDRRARHRNVKNAFALDSNAVIHPTQHYIVVDDVFTTGSTLNACCQVLRNAGAENLDVVTLGHG